VHHNPVDRWPWEPGFPSHWPCSQSPNLILSILEDLPGVVDAELDQVVNVATGGAQPPSLVDTAPVQYYGSTAWNGYVNQPATQIINLAQAQQNFNVSGTGIIADIDTGVDPNHPVLVPCPFFCKAMTSPAISLAAPSRWAEFQTF
jgi:hypothetical protein